MSREHPFFLLSGTCCLNLSCRCVSRLSMVYVGFIKCSSCLLLLISMWPHRMFGARPFQRWHHICLCLLDSSLQACRSEDGWIMEVASAWRNSLHKLAIYQTQAERRLMIVRNNVNARDILKLSSETELFGPRQVVMVAKR
jgi:hypothetical protein